MTETLVSEKQISLAQDGELDPLVKLLRHTDDNVRSLAQKAVANLSNSEHGVVVKDKNGFAPLIELVKSTDEEVRSKAVWSIAILASTDENQVEIISQLGWESIMGLIKDKVVEVQCGGITLLGNLALLDENKEQIIQKNGVDVLMALLKETRDIIVKRAIVTALSNIVDSDNAIEVFDDDSLSFLTLLLERSEDERLLSGVVHTISNIANAEDSKFNRQIVKKSLRRLIELLSSPVDVIQKGAVMALNGISSTTNYQHDIIKHGGVKKMASLIIDSDDDELVLGIVLCINNLAQNERNHEDLVDLDIPKILEDLAASSTDPNIQSECEEALSAVNDGVMSGKKHTRSRSHRVKGRDTGSGDIRDNVRKIIEVLIADPRNQDRLRDSGVIPHLVSLIGEEQRSEELKGLALDALTMLAINNTRNQNDISIPDQSRSLISLESVIRNNMAPPKIMVRAVRLVGALCWKNKLIQGLVAENTIVTSLVSMLDTYDNNLKKATLTALACIAEDNDLNKVQISKLGADKVIAKILMKEAHPDSLVASAAQAVAALAKENATVQQNCSKVVGHLVDLLQEAVRVPHSSAVEDHIVQEQLCAALHELARDSKYNKAIMWKPARKLMIEILYNASASTYSHYHALALLWEFSKSSKKKEVLASNTDLTRALRPLTESKDSSVRDAANRLKERLGKL